MTDYFALLDQPRRPWLEPDQLKQAFHAQALQSHPDAQAQHGDEGSSDAAFAELNEAYQVLQDPKRRIQHLLTLSGSAPNRRPAEILPEIGDLFSVVAAVTQGATALVEQSAGATTALSRSLLKPQLLQMDERLNDALEKLRHLQQNGIERLRELDRAWGEGQTNQFSELQQLYLQFGYVTRWMAELEEKRVQLASV